jgi:DNA replication ATP-dependent helicase Dna2
MNWLWAIGRLTNQGRMHREISNIVSHLFYQNNLNIVEGVKELEERQTRIIDPQLIKCLAKTLPIQSKRLQFVNIDSNKSESFQKVNSAEANAVMELIQGFRDYFELFNIEINKQQIGIITPFRSQIALIIDLMEKHHPELVLMITVDTVERYQGGARDYVIISLCASSKFSMEAVVTENQDGLDRKLNVAITRAREMAIILGNKSIAEKYNGYQQIINL